MASIHPILLSVGSIEASHKEKSWLGEVALILQGNFSFQELERYILWLLIGLLIAVFILRVIAGNKKLLALRELRVIRHMKGLFREGENQAVALVPRLLGAPRQPKLGSSPELAVASTMAGLMNTQGGISLSAWTRTAAVPDWKKIIRFWGSQAGRIFINTSCR
ncbi:hypothetical protein [Pontibacter rugosus]